MISAKPSDFSRYLRRSIPLIVSNGSRTKGSSVIYPGNRVSTFADIRSQLQGLNTAGAGVFFTPNVCFGKRCADNVTAVRAVLVDLDGAPLAPVLATALKPHIVVQSSPGRFHAYWLTSGVALAEFRGLQQRIAEAFNGDSACCDLARVMRVPGFAHNKDMPFVSKIESVQPGRYEADEVRRWAASLQVTSTPKRKTGAGGAANHLRLAVNNDPPQSPIAKQIDLVAAPEGTRNTQLNRSAFIAGRHIAAGHITRNEAELLLTDAARKNGLPEIEISATLASGLDAGISAGPGEVDVQSEQAEGLIAGMNLKHAVVMVGGDCRVMNLCEWRGYHVQPQAKSLGSLCEHCYIRPKVREPLLHPTGIMVGSPEAAELRGFDLSPGRGVGSKRQVQHVDGLRG